MNQERVYNVGVKYAGILTECAFWRHDIDNRLARWSSELKISAKAALSIATEKLFIYRL